MEQVTESAARQAFADAVGMWRTSPSGAVGDLVESATWLLVAGIDTPHLRELAGASPLESLWVIEPILLATIDELNAGGLLGGSAERASLESMLRRFLSNRLGLREVSSWAHSVIGHDGDAELQPFVELDDIYDDWESAGFDLDELERIARGAAEEFLMTGSTEALDRVEPEASRNQTAARVAKRRWWRRRR